MVDFLLDDCVERDDVESNLKLLCARLVQERLVDSVSYAVVSAFAEFVVELVDHPCACSEFLDCHLW